MPGSGRRGIGSGAGALRARAVGARRRALAACLAAGLLAAPALSDATAARLPPEAAGTRLEKEVRATVEKATFELDVAPRPLAGDRAIFEYLVDHLEVCAVAARALRLGNYTTRREADGRLFGDDHQGSTGHLTVLERSEGFRAYFVQGEKKGLFHLKGKSVVELRFGPLRGDGKDRYAVHAWVKVENPFLALLSLIFVARARKMVEAQFYSMLLIPVKMAERIRLDRAEALAAFDRLPPHDRNRLAELRAEIGKRPGPPSGKGATE